MNAAKVNCWEHLRCGREPGGPREREFGPCPAATNTTCDGTNGGRNAGRLCWAVPGTMCCGKVHRNYEEKIRHCRDCSFFRRIKAEEGYHFQLIEPGLGIADPVALHRLLNNIVILIGVKRDIFACLAVRPLLGKIARYAREFTRSASASAYLLDEAGTVLSLAAHAGRVDRPRHVRLAEDTPACRSVRNGALSEGRVALPGLAGPATVAAIPFSGHEGACGVLELLKDDGGFSQDDEWFLGEFGFIAAMGIENARQVEDLRQLRRFDKAKSRFVALLMHHITSPLATIACSLQALSQLADRLSEDDRTKLMACSLERIASIQGLSRKLLDLAAIRHGTSLVEVRPVWPGEPLRQEVEDRLARARDKGLEIVLNEPKERPCVLADPNGLRLVFGSLLNNAIKYTTGAGKTVDVDVSADSGSVRVRIRDHGIGIPPEERQKIFDEFYRGTNIAAAPDAAGFGLGLAIVKELVDRYNGQLDLQSDLGAGTTVTVELPIVQPGRKPPTKPAQE